MRNPTTYIGKLANDTSATDLNCGRLIGRSRGITTVTRTTNCAPTYSVVTTWNADHFEGRVLASTLGYEEWVALVCGSRRRIELRFHRRKPGGNGGGIAGRRKVSRGLSKHGGEENSRTHPLCWSSVFPFACYASQLDTELSAPCILLWQKVVSPSSPRVKPSG